MSTLEELYARAKRNPETGCLEWQGSLRGNGYGGVRFEGKDTHAHRVVYVLVHNIRLTADQDVLHTCDTPSCIEPSHLFLGDAQVNMDDKVAKGRWRGGGPKGEGNGQAVLTEAIVREMRTRHANGESINSLAVEFGVDNTAAGKAIRGITWKHIT